MEHYNEKDRIWVIITRVRPTVKHCQMAAGACLYKDDGSLQVSMMSLRCFIFPDCYILLLY